MTFKSKRIIVGVCGGIAAYKSAELVRLLVKAGADVQVVMTQSAKQFITPLTLQALSHYPVRDDLFSLEAENAMGHIELARWADLIVIAPATANLMAQLAHGFCDDLLTTLCLATTAKIALLPAMNQQMWHHTVTQQNLTQLQQQGCLVWGPAEGEQACGDNGFGRMLEASQIMQRISDYWQPKLLTGKKILITAGATREALDPVRCLTNISSGKMGYALAQAACFYGAEVILISGPTALTPPSGVNCIMVESALAMHQAVFDQLDKTDCFIAAAAVTDYRPANYSTQKIRKNSDGGRSLTLVLNPDIVKDVAQSQQRPPCVVGFAAETENLLENATKKLQQKQLDFIIANRVGQGQGMESDVNAATLIGPDGVAAEFPVMTKIDLAKKLIAALLS